MITFPDTMFVTGTDTDVGKTVISAILCAGLRADYWKPVQAGRDPLTDSDRVREWAGLAPEQIHSETYCMEQAASPHAAAEAEGIRIDVNRITLPVKRGARLIVEGAGGLLVPLNWEKMVLDLLVQLDLPVLLVARSGLGTLNHTLMSLQILESRDIKPWGVVLNGPVHRSNEETIRHFGQVERLFRCLPVTALHPQELPKQFESTFLQYAP